MVSKSVGLFIAGLIVLGAGAGLAVWQLDRCPQHATAQSRSLSARVAQAQHKSGAFRIADVVERAPRFACLAGPKAHFFELKEFARARNYSLPKHEFNCGFWSARARLMLFYDDAVVEAPVEWRTWTDDSETRCSDDPKQEWR